VIKLTSIALLVVAFITVRAADEPRPRSGILQLFDGSNLHGKLREITTTEGLVWEHSAAKEPLKLLLTNVSLVRFDRAQQPEHSFKASSRFQFKNGDELIGNILEINDQKLRVQTWFGDNLQADLRTLDAITFSAKGYNLLYEGPTGIDGWHIGRNAKSWEYRDGAFVANGADLLGRDFGLNGSATLEFELQWNGAFSLSIILYSASVDRFDYGSNAYVVYLGTGSISIQRVQGGTGAIMLGQTQLPEMLRRSRMRFELRCNKEDATISLFADGKFVQRWKDSNAGGFVAKGTGIVFFSQVEPRSLKLSNIRVAEWDGRFEPDSVTNAPPDVDVIYLANKDKVLGKVESLGQDKANVTTKQAKLDIPISRITQIRFSREGGLTNSGSDDLRASFPGGETVVFKLEKWDGAQVTGTSQTFGSLAFDPKNIRQLQFNLHRAQSIPEKESSVDTEFLEAE
jgi:hypothetical protein